MRGHAAELEVVAHRQLREDVAVDRLVGEIENHDAVVEAGIRESRRLYARAVVRHSRMRVEGERLRAKLDGLRSHATAWRGVH